jgi:drug/metabolite transporter (DMT)-like permease
VSTHSKALIALLIAALLWATAGAVAKILVVQLHPFVVTTYRFLIASLVVLPFFLKEKKPKHYWKILIPLSLLNSGNVILFYTALTTTTANSAMVITGAGPLLTACFSWLLIKEKTSVIQIIGIVIGLMGVLLVALLPVLSAGHGLGGNVVGNSLLIFSSLCWVLYTIGSRHLLSNARYSPLTTVSMNFFVTLAVSFGMALLTRQSFYSPVLLQPNYIATLMFAAVGVTVVTFSLFQWAIQHLPATTASLKDYVQLIAGVGLNTLLFGERLSLEFVFGGALVMIGVLIATGQRVTKKLTAVFVTNK